MIFVNSMSDLFHKDVPKEFIGRVFDTMETAHWHTFQVLTKRGERLESLLKSKLRVAAAAEPQVVSGVGVEGLARLHAGDHALQARVEVALQQFA